jgi:4-carboxymuconolactone decarboxylase
MLLSPPVGMALQALGSALRFDSCLTERQRELAILTVASHWGSTFEWETHEAIGRAAGLTDEELRSIASRSPTRLREPTEQATVDWVRRILASWTTDDDGYREAIAALGQRPLYELTTLVGYYSILALHLRIFAREDDTGLQEQQRRQPPNGRPSAP